jgi:hypothetical protein
MEEQLRAKDQDIAALHAKLKQASQYNEVDHGATNIRLSAQVEELQQKLLTMVGAKNLSDQKARDAKGALKGAQDAGDAARKQLAETQYELRRALQTNESLKLKMMQNGLSTTLGSPAAAAKAGATTTSNAAALAASADAAAASAAALSLAPPAGGETAEGGDAAAAAAAPADSTHASVPAGGQ